MAAKALHGESTPAFTALRWANTRDGDLNMQDALTTDGIPEPVRISPAPPSEWRANWPLLLCCVLGIPVPMVATYTLGQFLQPLEHEFGWSRTEASVGLSLSLLLGFVAAPIVGKIVDGVNARLLALPGIVLTGLSLAAFSLANANPAVWIGLWCLSSLLGALVGPTVWITVLSAAFDKKRSMAISIALCGSALAGALGPASARLLIDAYGWRTAFQLLGLIWAVPPLIFAVLCFFDRRPLNARKPATYGTADPTQIAKPAMRQILLSGNFIKLALAILASQIVLSAFMIHLAPALADKGLSLSQAAFVAGIGGLFGIPGKLVVGSLFDRLGSAPVALGIMALLAMASGLLAMDSQSVVLAVLGCMFTGLAGGAFLAFVACATSQLFDQAVFGVVYGLFTSLCVLGGAVGPLAASAVHDATGAYAAAFWVGIGVAVVGAALLTSLAPRQKL